MCKIISVPTSNVKFVANIFRVQHVTEKDKLYILLAFVGINIVFAPLHILAKVFVVIFAGGLMVSRLISLIYNSNILKSPIMVDRDTLDLSYFDELALTKRRKTIHLPDVQNVKVFYQNGQPFIFEIKTLNQVKQKLVEENINIEAFDLDVINSLIAEISTINPKVEIEQKWLQKKGFGPKRSISESPVEEVEKK